MSTAIVEAEVPQVVAQANNQARLASVFVANNLAQLKDEEKAAYYMAVCESTGLNPATRPFEFVAMRGGKTVLYALKGATDQLRKINSVSVDVSKEITNGMLIVTAKATDSTGRIDSDVGVVSIAGLQGDDLCNAMMKAVTKAKRRVTLSICGLGMLDESELETIPGARPVKTQVVTNPDADSVDLDEVKNLARQGLINRLKEAFSSYAPKTVEGWYGKHFNKSCPEDLSDFELEVAIERVNSSKK